MSSSHLFVRRFNAHLSLHGDLDRAMRQTCEEMSWRDDLFDANTRVALCAQAGVSCGHVTQSFGYRLRRTINRLLGIPCKGDRFQQGPASMAHTAAHPSRAETQGPA
jgi:hypothetical protein